MSPRTVELERLAARVEMELRAVKAEGSPRVRTVVRAGKPGRPPRARGDDDHGTEQDYQAEAYEHRFKGGPPPCELCKAAHALRERRRARGAA